MSDEEQNLSRRERRAQAKTAKSAGDGEDVKDRNQRLRAEAAAKRRRLREAERASAAEEGLDAGERVDDAFVRGADAGARFLRDNFAWLQWIIIVGVMAAMGMLIYEYRQGVDREKQGAKVASILDAVYGRLAEAEPLTASDARLNDPRSEYATDAERDKAIGAGWDKLKGSKVPTLKLAAALGRAGLLYDQGKYAEARSAYQKVLGDGKAALYPQLKGRALEGVGLTFEAEKKYSEAKKHFEKLASIDTKEFKNLKGFHLARMEYLLGNRDEAKKLLQELDVKLSEGADARGPTDYVGAAVRDLLKTADPSVAIAEQKALQDEQMKEFMKRFEEMQKKGGGPTGAAPGIPGAPGAPGAPPMAPPIDLKGLTPPPVPDTPEPGADDPPTSPPKAPAPTSDAPSKAPTPQKAPTPPAPKPPTAPAPAPEAPPAAPTPPPAAPAPAPAPETP